MRFFPPRRILCGGHGACPELNDEILRYTQNDMRRVQNDKFSFQGNYDTASKSGNDGYMALIMNSLVSGFHP